MASRRSNPAQPHTQLAIPPAGFTMVELIVVIILAGILAAVAGSRFFKRTSYDAAAGTEQLRAMVRYGQKVAIAQNRNVYVVGSVTSTGGGVALCYSNSVPCPVAQIIPAPGGANSGASATRSYCVSGGAYVANWACEAFAPGVLMNSISGSFSTFYFNGLGKPFLPGDLPANGAPSQDSTFQTTTYTFIGDGASIPVTIYQETGYVN